MRAVVDGPGVLQGLGSADPAPAEPRTFDGRALAVVRPTGPGEITVTISADGCADVVVTLSAR